MPQMAPMNWILLFSWFILMVTLTTQFLHFLPKDV